MKLQSVLIANRGEIASRVIRAARDFGIRAVAVYADSDVELPFVSEADHALPLYGDSPSETYLNITKIISCAQKAKVDAIHPGYGFLSESAEFAAKVIEAGFIWIGPRPETIELLGDKARARRLAQQIGAPLIAGTGEPISGTDEITDFVVTHGYPIVIKAVHGGEAVAFVSCIHKRKLTLRSVLQSVKLKQHLVTEAALLNDLSKIHVTLRHK